MAHVSPHKWLRRLRGKRWAALALIGLAALVASASLAAAERAPMTFSVGRLDSAECGARCPEVIVADGVIEPETPAEFVDFARQAALQPTLRSIVLLNSPGGNVVASMELGGEFRKLRLAAIVAAYGSGGGVSGPVAGECVSACVYTLMGAVRRIAPPQSLVALHRMSAAPEEGSFGGERHFADPRLVAIVARYAARMGVDPKIVWTAELLPPDHVHLLSREEMRRSRLAGSRF